MSFCGIKSLPILICDKVRYNLCGTFVSNEFVNLYVIVFENKDAQDALSDCPDENLQTD